MRWVAGTTATYTYDGDGIRVPRTQGTTTGYVHDRAAGLPTVIDDGARRYVQGPSGLAYSLAGSALSVHHVDALGSVRALSDSTAALTQRYQRDAWGTQTVAQGSSTQPFGFTGELSDAASGLLHLRARDYDPATGRLMQRDTFAGRVGNPLSLHRYGYAFNNPVSLRDPSGRDPLIDGGTGTGCLSCDVMADSAAVVAAPAPSAHASALEPASVSEPVAAPESRASNPMPDYLRATANVAIPNPVTATAVGVSFSVVIDRNLSVYAGAGPAFGKTATVLSGSVTAGWLIQPTVPTAEQLVGFLTGWSHSVGGGWSIGAQATYSPSAQPTRMAIEGGQFTPQVGYSASWSERVLDFGGFGGW